MKLTLQQLEAHLWGAANILRGKTAGQDYKRVAEATPLPEFKHPERAMYVFGPENGSLDEVMLERCTHVVAIPGHTCSILAAAVNVVLYDHIAKRWAHMRDAFLPTDGQLRGVRGGYDRRLDYRE